MKYFIVGLLLMAGLGAIAQTPDIVLDQRYHHLIDREDIKNPQGFTAVKPYNRQDIINRLEDSTNRGTIDINNKAYLDIDNYLFLDDSVDSESKKPFLKRLYVHKPDFYSHRSENFKIGINPVLSMNGGGKTTAGERMFLNTRGFELKGSIDNKIGFYSMLTDNQARFPDYVSSRILANGAVIGENFWQAFNTTGYDFFTAKGYINFQATKSIKLKFGYDKNFIGDGYRSMILSDYSGNYTHLRVDTKVWKLNYTNIFADMTADFGYNETGTYGTSNYPRKILAFHHLSLNIRKNFNIGLFESITYGGDTTAGVSGFDLNYLNPVIFYRTVESNLGSGGNALLGMNFKWNLWNHVSFYGQFVLDEFSLSHLAARDGWWGNKFGGQLGMKYIDIANVNGLDMQLEFNGARPYTYSHTYKNSSYSHFNQSLAHPLGANFNEFIAIMRYQPHAKVFLTGKVFAISQGLDFNGDNYGSDILLPNSTHIEYGDEIGHNHLQGNKTKTLLGMLGVSYMVKHNLFLEADIYVRNSKDLQGLIDDKTAFANVGIRWNLPSRQFDY